MTKPVQHDVTEMLRKTREIVASEGWRRGILLGDEYHDPVEPGCTKCVLNAKRLAIRQAYNMPMQLGVAEIQEIISYTNLSSLTETALGKAVDALYPKVVAKMHPHTSSGTKVILWNDSVCQSQEQALELIDKAIELSVLADIAKEKTRAAS
jgi:SpoU rRNA methylase family enzyme